MLTPELVMLFDVLDAADYGPPHDLAAALAALPPAGALPAPHATWTLLALARYSMRKRWAQEAIDTRLAPVWVRRHGGAPLERATGRAFLPGLPEWEAELQHDDSYLVHRATHERIHVDLLNGPEVISRCRFVQYLLEHRGPGPAERRVLELHPGCKALPLALDALTAAGVLHVVEEDEFILCTVVTGRTASIGEFLDLWEGSQPAERVWLAARVGDWPAAQDAARAAGDSGLVRLTGLGAEDCRRRRLDALRATAEVVGFQEGLLHALTDVGDPDLPRQLDEALRQPHDPAAEAMELIADDPAYVPAVEALYGRALSRQRDCLYLTTPCARYLARHGPRPGEVIEALLATPQGREPAEAALLALAYAPKLTLWLMREALRSRNGYSRLTAAAALALVDRPWGRRELRAVLDGSDDPGATVECRAALRESRDPESRRAAAEWEARHPDHEAAPRRSLYERRGGCERVLAARMVEPHDRIDKVQDREPEEVAPS